MNQTRAGSLVEALVNVAIGCSVALASQYAVFPLVGIGQVSFATHLEITAYFTLISIARGYLVRRYFNNRLHRFAMRVTGGAK